MLVGLFWLALSAIHMKRSFCRTYVLSLRNERRTVGKDPRSCWPRKTNISTWKKKLHAETIKQTCCWSVPIVSQIFHLLTLDRMRILSALLLGFSLVSPTSAKPTASHGVGLFGVPRGGGLFGGKGDEKATWVLVFAGFDLIEYDIFFDRGVWYIFFFLENREESRGDKKLYPALSVEEIEDWMEHIPVFAVTDSNGAGVVLKPDDSTSGEHSWSASISRSSPDFNDSPFRSPSDGDSLLLFPKSSCGQRHPYAVDECQFEHWTESICLFPWKNLVQAFELWPYYWSHAEIG